MKLQIKHWMFIAGMSVITIGCEKDGKETFYQYPEPTVEGIYPESGFAGSQMSINGTNFGDRVEPVKVYFNGVIADSIVSCKDNRIVVYVPEGARTGDVSLEIWQHKIESAGAFTVLPNPTVSSVTSDNTVLPVFATEGDILTITGTGFGTDASDVRVRIGQAFANVTSVNDTEIKAEVPEGYGSGMVTVSVKGYEMECAGFLEPTYTGDVTTAFLKNCTYPFARTNDELIDIWGVPADWLFNDAFYFESNGQSVNKRCLNNDMKMLSFLCNQWSTHNTEDYYLENAKMYQVTRLPKGKYLLSWDAAECSYVSGNFGMIIGVTKGNGTLPDMEGEGRTWSVSDETSFLGTDNKSYFMITDEPVTYVEGKYETFSMEFEQPEDGAQEVTLGFVANITMAGTKGGCNVTIRNISLERLTNN